MQQQLPQKLLAFIWHFLKPYKLPAGAFALLAMSTGLYGPFNSILTKWIIDLMNLPPAEHNMWAALWPALLFVLNFEAHNLCWRGMGYLNYKFQPIIKNQIISETFGYVHQQSQQFFQDNLSGRIANHINILVDGIERIVHDISRHVFRSIMLIAAALVSMYVVHPSFFYVLLAWLIIFSTVSMHWSKRLVALAEKHAATESALSGQVVDSIANASNVRAFARRQYEIGYIGKALTIMKKAFQAKEIFAIKLHFFQGFSLTAMIAGMLYFLIYLRSQDLVSVGDFALILTLSIEVGFMIWWTLEQVDELNKAVGRCRQSIDALLQPIAIKDKVNAVALRVTEGEIAFSKVKFHYKNSASLFENKSVTIAAGQKVGLVGYSGSGKSTFVNLILRLYDVNDGSIQIDGQDIRDVTQVSLHSSIAMIPQDPSLFHRSLMENIRYGRIEATDQEVIKAAKQAHAHEFIHRLEQGYESLVGERGVKLSGGQRQRIAIARAILKNAPILLLDEATSQLDSLTESEIQESLWGLMRGKTTIVIAHRLSTLLHMDRILVFNRGKIVQDGTHRKLLSQGGLYKTMWDAQVGGFLPESKDQHGLPEEVDS